MSILQDALVLVEARSPKGNYSEKYVKDKLDKVVLELSGSESAKFTRMAKTYKTIDAEMQKLIEIRNGLNEEAKAAIEESFDPVDEVATRIIQTVSLTLSMSKTSKPTPKVNYEAVVTELLKLQPELLKQIEALKVAYTDIPTPRKGALKVEVNEDISSMWKAAKAKFSAVILKFQNWARSYDKRLAELKNMLK